MAEARELPQLQPFSDFIYDAEKIALGAYSPLESFMDEESYQSVLSNECLPNGLPWTIPIILAPREPPSGAKIGDEVALLDGQRQPFATMLIEDQFTIDRRALAERTYGTWDPLHPNVHDIATEYGDRAFTGKLTCLQRLQHPTGTYELSPKETRRSFKEKGWSQVVGYQCRNPPHTAHEYLQKTALETAEIDGLFVHPVVGRLKRGDYKPAVILEAYRAVVDQYYPKERVLLSSLSITMRYGGPKAALFLAIIRKNYGCTHYIVGRDQAGVGNRYDPYACHRIFDQHDIGITPMRYLECFYCRACGSMATAKTCPHDLSSRVDTSQTKIRDAIRQGRPLPGEILRPEVVKILSRGDVILDR